MALHPRRPFFFHTHSHENLTFAQIFIIFAGIRKESLTWRGEEMKGKMEGMKRRKTTEKTVFIDQ
jgi:hypothetical protein